MRKNNWYPEKEQIEASKEFYKQNQLVYYTPIEELFNSVIHSIGIIAAIVGFIFMLVKSSEVKQYLTSTFIFIGFFALYANSTLYHATNSLKFKKVLRVFDHATVNLLVLSCGLTICLCTSNHIFNIIAVASSCFLIITSYILSWINLNKFKNIILAHNFVIGIMLFAVYLINRNLIEYAVELLFLLGTITCILGALVYSLKIPFAHTVFHVFVLFGPLLFLIAQAIHINSI